MISFERRKAWIQKLTENFRSVSGSMFIPFVGWAGRAVVAGERTSAQTLVKGTKELYRKGKQKLSDVLPNKDASQLAFAGEAGTAGKVEASSAESVHETHQMVKTERVDGVSGNGEIKGKENVRALKKDKNLQVLLKDTECSSKNLVSYLKNLDAQNAKRNVTSNYTDTFAETGKWPAAVEAQIPKNNKVLKADGSGEIDWNQVPCDGHTTKIVRDYDKLTGEIVNRKIPIKDEYAPRVGEVIDRYGPSNGRYTSPTKYGVILL